MLRHRFICLLALVLMVTGCTSCGGGGRTAEPIAQEPPTVETPAATHTGTPAIAQKTPTFNAPRAYADLQKQCSFGARIPGSTAHADCLAWLKTQFPGATKLVNQNFSAQTPYGGPYNFTNVLALYGGGKGGVPFLICAHWDTRPVANMDPDPANRTKPVMGANDGASGVAVILELARVMQATPPSRPVLLALLDAEDSGKDGSNLNDYSGFCIGADYLAQHWPAGLTKPEEGVLLDLVGRASKSNPRIVNPPYGAVSYLDLPIEANSLDTNPTLVNALWTIAEGRGHSAFRRTVGRRITDDHLPLIAVGIKCIDLIQFPPPEWHTIDDTPEYCSAEALNQTGDTLVRYLYEHLSPAG